MVSLRALFISAMTLCLLLQLPRKRLLSPY